MPIFLVKNCYYICAFTKPFVMQRVTLKDKTFVPYITSDKNFGKNQ